VSALLERALTFGFPKTLLGFAVAVAVLGLAACGRKGPLDLPPSDMATPVAPQASSAAPIASPTSMFLPGSSAAAASGPDAATKTGFDARGNPVAATGQRKSFFLDPLLQ
jgi:predicted small lipoprotein YifL